MTSRRSNHTRRSDVIVTLDDSRPYRLVLVDDHTMFRDLLRTSLEAAGHEVVDSLDGSEEDLTGRIARHGPDLVLLDLHMGEDYPTSLPLLEELTNIDLEVVVVTASEDHFELAACLEAGARGFITKSAPLDVLQTGVEKALLGRPLISSVDRMSMLIDLRIDREHRRRTWAPFDRLTTRESEVLRMLCDGKTAKEIATESFVSLATVRSQIRSVLSKLGVSSQLAAVGMARKTGWLNR